MKKLKNFFKDYWITALIILLMVLSYKYISDRKLISPMMFPNIGLIGKAFYDNRQNALINVASSFQLLAPSILITLVLALGIGFLMGLHEKLRKVLYPIVYAFSCVPSILLSPFALLLAPSFRMASLFLIVYESIWSTVFGTITGIMTIDKRYLDKADVLKLRGLKRYLYVILPAASPSIISGFINSLSGTFVMLVYAEMYGAEYGMGYYVRQNAALGLYDRTWAGFIFMIIVLVIVMQCFEKIRNRILHWTM